MPTPTGTRIALQSDVPVSPDGAPEFSACLVNWFEEENITPICLSGLPDEKNGVPELYGTGTSDAIGDLDALCLETPTESGLVSGPTGAILADAGKRKLDAVGLIVQAHANFPDPEAARTLLLEGIGPVADIQVDTRYLVERAEEIADARKQLAQRMQEADEESTQAQSLGM